MNQLIVISLMLILSQFVLADDHAAPKYGALDVYPCKFDKGNKMSGLEGLFGDYTAQNYAPGSLYFILTPFAVDLSNIEFDFVWMGRYGSHEEMGMGMLAYSEKIGTLNDQISNVMTCEGNWMITGFTIASAQ